MATKSGCGTCPCVAYLGEGREMMTAKAMSGAEYFENIFGEEDA